MTDYQIGHAIGYGLGLLFGLSLLLGVLRRWSRR